MVKKYENFEIGFYNLSLELVAKKVGTLLIFLDSINHRYLFRFYKEKKCFTHEVIFDEIIEESILKQINKILIKNFCFIYNDFLVLKNILLINYSEKKLIFSKEENDYFIFKNGIDKSKILYFPVIKYKLN